MNTLRRLIQLPMGLVHVALLVHAHRTHGLVARRALSAVAGATFVIAIALALVYTAGCVGVVPY
jgi:hypothetical protein